MAKARQAAAKAPKATGKAKTGEIKAAKTARIEKRYLKARPACKVTFILPKDAAHGAESVCILGEFNNWAQDAHPLKKQENGDFVTVIELEKDRSYRFRYIIDGWKYENDWSADRYEPNPYGGEDSVVDV